MSLVWMQIYIEFEWLRLNWNEWRMVFEQSMVVLIILNLFEILFVKVVLSKTFEKNFDLLHGVDFIIFLLKWK